MALNTETNTDQDELAIAIVGMAGRFPGADDVEQLWANLASAVESVKRFSIAELNAAGADPATLQHPLFVPAGAPLEGVDRFDAEFFGIPPREAALMDPQHRIFLECAWHALEHAGCVPARYRGRIGVYAGAALSTYLLCNLHRGQRSLLAGDGYQLLLGNDKDFIVTRTSYKLGLRGPSCVVQTACSTSLVAVHMACQALLNGETDMALAGGVSVLLPQGQGYVYQEGMISSRDGHCRAFDCDASGTIVGNGVGLVVLKRLDEALSEGDTIHAVIKGSAINNDGSLKVSYSAPSVDGQAQVIRAAHRAAGIDPSSIGYVEAHGTGTPMGDPIEISALHQAFGRGHPHSCALGSIKSNIGHLNTAAGIAGLIKAVLALKHEQIPPSLHFTRANPAIDFASGPFFVADKLIAWPRGAAPRRAGVSSFGIGGTNAHLVLEEAPQPMAAVPDGEPQLVVLSARTRQALDLASERLAEHLARNPQLDLADVSFTLACGRETFAHRRALVCRELERAAQLLREQTPGGVADPSRPVVFMFPGQGAQYCGMARGLYLSEPCFKRAIDACAQIIDPALGKGLRTLLFDPSTTEAELADTRITQPVLFCLGYALAQTWEHYGVRPTAMIGHSLGEYVAACHAGTLSLRAALSLVLTRARLIAALPKGAMLAVASASSRVAALLPAGAEIAAENGPNDCVVSGTLEAIAAAEDLLLAQELSPRRVRVSHAFHSAMMEGLEAELSACVRGLALQPPRIPYISNVTGTWITAEQATDPRYWYEHLRRPVRFHAGLTQLISELQPIMLEVGPGRALGALARQLPEARELPVLATLRHARESHDDREHLLHTLARLFVLGQPVRLQALHPERGRKRVPLPGYPFARRRHWVEPAPFGAHTDVIEIEVEPELAAVPMQRSRAIFAPSNPLEARMCAVWRRMFGLEELGIHDDFFELGGQSMLASRLCLALGQELGTRVPVSALFEAKTVAALAARIAAGDHAREQPDAVAAADAALEASISSAGVRAPARDVGTVLVTGATGFLGAFLVEALARETRAEIVCLVRGQQGAQQRLEQHLHRLRISSPGLAARLRVIAADLGAPRFGLDAYSYAELAAQTDVIYHAGAWVNFTYPYRALRQTNVLGTQEILRLACSDHLKPLHFISTAAVFSGASSGGRVVREHELPGLGTGHNGYEQSKVVAEHLVSEARARGIPVAVYRPATVTGHTRTGAANTRDLLLRTLLGCIDLGAWPRADFRIHLAPVDYVAHGIVKLSLRDDSLGRTFHSTSPSATRLDELVAVAAAVGHDLPVIEYDAWRAQLMAVVRARPDHPLAPFAPLFGEQQADLSLALDCSEWLSGLADTALPSPALEASSFRATLAWLREADASLAVTRPRGA